MRSRARVRVRMRRQLLRRGRTTKLKRYAPSSCDECSAKSGGTANCADKLIVSAKYRPVQAPLELRTVARDNEREDTQGEWNGDCGRERILQPKKREREHMRKATET
eukprot:6187195-Pleurochrysis_carterae.AAC.5